MRIDGLKFCMLIALMFIGARYSAHSQGFYNQGALITISSNTTMVVPDSIVNNGEITNNGNLVVQGTWINNNQYNSGTGSMTLASSTPQVLNHNDQSLTQLTISGGGDKIFEQDFVVEDELILEDGLLISVNGARVIVNQGASITGASNDSYIVGEIIHQGTGNKYFPVGTLDAFLPFELIDVEGINPEVGLTASADNINLDVVGSLDEVSSRWFWQLQVLGGEYFGSPVRLAVNQESFSSGIEQYVVAEALTSENPFRSLGQEEFSGDSFDGFVQSSLKGVGGIYAIGLDASIVEESPPIGVFNAVTPNGDNRHEFLKIENIEYYPDNQVVIFNKLGNKVFEINGYDNLENVFSGFGNVIDTELLSNGTYYYLIDKKDGSKAISGYFVLSK